MRLFIVRHGESYINTQGRLMSSTDLPLTEKGVRQAEAARDYIREILAPGVFHRVFSSPLLRARQTAEIICGDEKKLEIFPALREMDLGKLEGLSWAESAALYPEVNFDHGLSEAVLPEGESFEELETRCRAFCKRLEMKDDQNVLIASHGITIRALINCLLGKESRFVNVLNWADNTALTEITFSPDGIALRRLNDITHLTARGLNSDNYETWCLFSKVDYFTV